MLLDLGRAVDPHQWCTGLVVKGQRQANGAVLAGLIRTGSPTGRKS